MPIIHNAHLAASINKSERSLCARLLICEASCSLILPKLSVLGQNQSWPNSNDFVGKAKKKIVPHHFFPPKSNEACGFLY